VIRIKETHETQSTEQYKSDVNDEKLYTPIEDLQRIEAGGVYNRNSFDTSKFPKRIRYLGYFLFGSFVLMLIAGIIIGLIFN